MKKLFSFGLLIAVATLITFSSCKKNNEVKKVTGIKLSEKTKTIEEGEEFMLTATVEPANAADKSVVWKSEKTAIATVDRGKVKGISVGETDITVTTIDGNKTDTCHIIVKNNSKIVQKAITLDDIAYLEDAVEGAYPYEIILITPEDALDEEGKIFKAGILYVFTVGSNKPVGSTYNPTKGNYIAKDGREPMTIMMGRNWMNREFSYSQAFDENGYYIEDPKPIQKGGILTLSDDKIAFKGETTEDKINIEYRGDYEVFNNGPWRLEPKEKKTKEVTFTKARLIYYNDTENTDSKDINMLCKQDNKTLSVDFFVAKDATALTPGIYNIETIYGNNAVGTIQKSPGGATSRIFVSEMSSTISFLEGVNKTVYFFDKGTAVVTDKKIEFDIISHFGSTLKITYAGDLTVKESKHATSEKAKTLIPLKP